MCKVNKREYRKMDKKNPVKNQVHCPQANKMKLAFESEEKADLFMGFNSPVILEKNGKCPIRSYKCPSGCGWHVTSKAANKKRYTPKPVQQITHNSKYRQKKILSGEIDITSSPAYIELANKNSNMKTNLAGQNGLICRQREEISQLKLQLSNVNEENDKLEAKISELSNQVNNQITPKRRFTRLFTRMAAL
jgi:hypothetical protein